VNASALPAVASAVPDSRGAASEQADLALLRSFEPIIRYTQGELFFPSAIEPYLAECDLWAGSTQRNRHLVLPLGEVTTETLADAAAPPGESLFLRLAQHPLNGVELARWNLRPDRPAFRSPGRLARVGLFARLMDAGFNASLLLRGRVPGGTAAAAQVKYGAAREHDPRYVYLARVVREGGWIVLHYLYFYWMNDWRSTFQGANDHEADLEQAFVVLEDKGTEPPRPVWFGYAAHDYTGDDLRRRWDDPLLVKEGDHPVIFAGAGSHAAYSEAGEYLTTVPIPALRGLQRWLGGVREFWRDILRQGDPGDLAARFESALAVPFIDYARGDGVSIGPGQAEEWTPVLVDDSTAWVDGYRGLMGLDTRDRLGGERAPAGPKYARSGTVRQSWNDPLGFLGLWKVAPPGRLPEVLRERIAGLEAEREEATSQAGALAGALPGLQAEARSLAADISFAGAAEARHADMEAREAELASLHARRAQLTDSIEAVRSELARVEAGDLGDPRAHLKHASRPQPPEERRHGMIVEVWSALSASLLLISMVALLYLKLMPVWAAILIALGGYIVLESLFRRRFLDLLLRVTVFLALVGAAILVVTNAWLLVLAIVLVIAVLTLVDNVREIRIR
jgi:hypothetical protein